MYLNTPSRISYSILELCKEISPLERPEYLQVVPVENAQINECFGNVEKKIAYKGGEKVHGWVIREWRDVFIEAEFHAVWKSPKGALVDVTPTQSPEEKRLFLPDPAKAFTGTRISNIRKPLRPDAVIQEFFLAFDEWHAFVERHSVGQFGMVSLPRLEAEALERRRNDLQAQLIALPPIDRKAPCFCGSGTKYRNCCGR